MTLESIPPSDNVRVAQAHKQNSKPLGDAFKEQECAKNAPGLRGICGYPFFIACVDGLKGFPEAIESSGAGNDRATPRVG